MYHSIVLTLRYFATECVRYAGIDKFLRRSMMKYHLAESKAFFIFRVTYKQYCLVSLFQRFLVIAYLFVDFSFRKPYWLSNKTMDPILSSIKLTRLILNITRYLIFRYVRQNGIYMKSTLISPQLKEYS